MKFIDSPTNQNDVFEYTAKQVKRKLTSQEFLKIRNRPGFESSMIYLRTKFD